MQGQMGRQICLCVRACVCVQSHMHEFVDQHVYVCVHACVCMHVHLCVRVCVHVDTRGCQVYPQSISNLLFETGSLPDPGDHWLHYTIWSELLVSALPVLRL